MLEQAVKAMREGREPLLDRPLAAVAEVELHVPALLPEDYVADVHLRLSLYQRIAASNATQLDDMHAELVDRFGPLPTTASNLLHLARLRLSARAIGIRRLDFGPHGGSVLFEEKNQVDTTKVIRLIQKRSEEFRMEGSLKLRLARHLPLADERFDYIRALLAQLA
jgi:transcription-repair coupling factor (superfamily II helicase)